MRFVLCAACVVCCLYCMLLVLCAASSGFVGGFVAWIFKGCCSWMLFVQGVWIER